MPRGRDLVQDPRRDDPRTPTVPERSRDEDLELLERYRDRLSDKEQAALHEVGRFRTLASKDLERYLYDGNPAFQRDLKRLIYDEKLLRLVKPQELRQGGQKRKARPGETHYLTLTPEGKRVAEALRTNPHQVLYSGLRKPHELRHDAALYVMFQEAQADLLKRGLQPTRILLDYEFKGRLNKDLLSAKKLGQPERRRRLEEIAHRNGLTVVDGAIPLPDLRVEYESPEGERGFCDLEYVTPNYRAAGLIPKALAGFQLYAHADGGGTARGRRILDEIPSLAARIISL
jgi:hypothetical protein